MIGARVFAVSSLRRGVAQNISLRQVGPHWGSAKPYRPFFCTTTSCAQPAASAADKEVLNIIGTKGRYKIAVPLPSKDKQVFSMPGDNEQLRAFLADLVLEDPSIKSIAAYETSGAKIAGSTHGTDLLLKDWKLVINGKPYFVKAPLRSESGYVLEAVQDSRSYQAVLSWINEQRKSRAQLSVAEFINKCQDLGVVQEVAHQYLLAMNQTGAVLYFEKSLELSDVILLNGTQIQRNVEDKLDLPHIQMTQNDRFALVERLKKDIQPLAEERERLMKVADKQVQRIVWTVFFGVGFQFVLFARLTWWDLSWDVMEPVSYFTSVAETVIAGYFWFMFTGAEYAHMGLREVLFKWRLKKLKAKYKFDVVKYEALKARIAALEYEIAQFADDTPVAASNLPLPK